MWYDALAIAIRARARCAAAIVYAFGTASRPFSGGVCAGAALWCLLSHSANAGGLAATPPMGWNSWDAYGLTIDEAAFKANATVLARLRNYGWRYAVIDEGWYMKYPSGDNLQTREYQLDRHGRLIPAATRFPSASESGGLRSLADWTHKRGLKLGIHIVRGIPKQALRDNPLIADSAFHIADAVDVNDTCPWDDGNYGVRDNPAGQAYYDSLFKLYAGWKIDFVKVDCIANNPYRPSDIRQIADAISRSGRPMVLSLSPGPTNIEHAEEIGQRAQMWRISNDIWDGWALEHNPPASDFPEGIRVAFDRLALWNAHVRPGHWPDADMLPFGRLAPHPGWGEPRTSRLSRDEQQTQFVLWAIARSPLILGCNLTMLDEFTRSLITNQALIELNQGAWTSHPVTDLPSGYESVRVWVASQTHPQRTDRVVALFNVGSEAMTIRAPWAALGLSRSSGPVLDVISGEPIAQAADVVARLAPHASAVYRLR